MRKALLYIYLSVGVLTGCASPTPEKKSCIETIESIDAENAPYQYIATFESCNESKDDHLVQEYIFSLVTIGDFEKLNSPSLLDGKASDEQKKYWQAFLKDNL